MGALNCCAHSSAVENVHVLPMLTCRWTQTDIEHCDEKSTAKSIDERSNRNDDDSLLRKTASELPLSIYRHGKKKTEFDIVLQSSSYLTVTGYRKSSKRKTIKSLFRNRCIRSPAHSTYNSMLYLLHN